MKLIYITFFLVTITLQGCSQKDPSSDVPETVEYTDQVPEYHFAVHPLHNPTRLFEVFNPLVEYLNKNIPEAHFVLEASRDYATFNNKLKNETIDFALPNPYQTLIAIQHHYKVIAKMGDDENFKGIILVRKDSNIKTPKDLKGKIISYPAPTALAATMLPQYYLQTHGLNINKDVQNKYVGSQESSIMNVFLGTTIAGATWPPPWKAITDENPEIKKQLKIIWQTQSLPNNSIVVKETVPEALVDKVKNLLITLNQNKEGKQILQTMYLSKFETANNHTYDSVQKFVDDFEKNVRPL